MEPHKHRVLRDFLKRFNITVQTLVDSLVKPSCRRQQVDNVEKEALPVVQQLMDCYDSLDDEWLHDPDGFLKLMILDGCFMLQILQWLLLSYDDNPRYVKYTGDGFHYAANDPIFSRRGLLYVMADIRKDMLMLENQLPMLLLKTLLGAVLPTLEEWDIKNHLIIITWGFLDYCREYSYCLDFSPPLHLLDLYKIRRTRTSDLGPATRFIKNRNKGNLCAMNLHDHGIKFEITTKNLGDIWFEGNILKLPLILIDDTTESILLNLIAFERLHVDAGCEVTSYVCFMSDLINSSDDVEILIYSGVLQDAIGSSKSVVKLFKKMAHNITPDTEHRLQNIVRKHLDEYCRIKWRKWRAYLSRTYFTNPWALVSFFSALLLLVLAIFQTLYTIYPYYMPSR